MDMLDHMHVDKLTNKELNTIIGGALTAAYITALVRGVTSIVDLGRSLGTILRRMKTKKLC